MIAQLSQGGRATLTVGRDCSLRSTPRGVAWMMTYIMPSCYYHATSMVSYLYRLSNHRDFLYQVLDRATSGPCPLVQGDRAPNGMSNCSVMLTLSSMDGGGTTVRRTPLRPPPPVESPEVPPAWRIDRLPWAWHTGSHSRLARLLSGIQPVLQPSNVRRSW